MDAQADPRVFAGRTGHFVGFVMLQLSLTFLWFQDPSSGILHQIWYDDPQSLAMKYEKALDLKLRGVGMWNAECVDYLSTEHDEIVAVKQMWDAFPNYKKSVL